ncbi:MAG: hypothetical protein JSW39_23435 [Desulfobacterales bacterium]|nr:MAG: hypothetical protein JSW39_23435 [Desulfobacterales bacterium]
MSYDWGPYFIVPSQAIKEYGGHVQLREQLDEDLLAKELRELRISGSIVKVTNPWYFRKKGEETWIKIGESEALADNFPVSWYTTPLENGEYEVLGLMHVFVKEGDTEHAIARQNIVNIAVKN